MVLLNYFLIHILLMFDQQLIVHIFDTIQFFCRTAYDILIAFRECLLIYSLTIDLNALISSGIDDSSGIISISSFISLSTVAVLTLIDFGISNSI
mmetsp:Transcript_32258/g.39650  ORF Transcript_32258/g.39650 Transcript_32258/m.39650 type:complete len:95 (-) Transcript_32258:169-453(-)